MSGLTTASNGCENRHFQHLSETQRRLQGLDSQQKLSMQYAFREDTGYSWCRTRQFKNFGATHCPSICWL